MPQILAVSGSEELQHYMSDPDQSLFMYLHVIGEEGQETCTKDKEYSREILKKKPSQQGVVGHPRCHIAVFRLCHTKKHVLFSDINFQARC